MKTTKSIDKNKIMLDKKGEIDFIGRTSINNGVQGKLNHLSYLPNPAGTFSVAQVGETVCLFRDKEWYAAQNIFILYPIIKRLSSNHIFISSAINKALYKYAEAYVYPTLNDLKHIVIFLPVKNGEIDFDFMEEFVAELESRRVAELESYLLATGLKDYTLTKEEEKVIEKINNGDIPYKQFTFNEIFNNIKQGRRLKNSDQIKGDIPFVMAGLTNNGVANYVANPIAVFPKNSITIDIFGNTFYRNYFFGAGDDTGVYYSTKEDYKTTSMLYFATAMRKAIAGKFSFGKKLRSSQSLNFKINLPVKNGRPDYETMETFISAIQKLVIKDVVLYADSKIEATKTVIKK